MKRIFAVAFIFIILLISCSTEKVNLSPIPDNIANEVSSADNLTNKTEIITHQSEITNLISSFPKLKNDAVDKEVDHLKNYLTDYITAISRKDEKAQKKAYDNYKNSYIIIQKLRKYLNKDMDDVLNRYMVRIKTNVNLLESIN